MTMAIGGNGSKVTEPEIKINPIPISITKITLVGDTPLLVGKYIPSEGRKIREVDEIFRLQQHYLPEKVAAAVGTPYGFPGSGIKKCGENSANSHIKNGVTKKLWKGAVFVVEYLAPLFGEPEPYVYFVPNSSNQYVQTVKAMYPKWRIEISVRYIHSMVKIDQVANIFNIAGTCTGLGTSRPGSNGQTFGTFHVE